eukprot:g46776.t1
MNDLFTKMQKKSDETRVKQQGMLDFYATSIGELLSANASAFSSVASAVGTSFASVKEMVSSGVSQSLQELLKQESMTQHSSNKVQKALEEHKLEMEKELKKNLQPIVISVVELNNCLKLNFQTYSGIAEKTASESCDTLVREITKQLKEESDTKESALCIVRDRVNDDKGVMMQHMTELSEHAEAGLNNVLNFLNEQLQQDIPTGTTPQRREYIYPRTFLRTEPRDALVVQFKAQQQQLQNSLNAAMSIQEEPVCEQ